MPIVMESLRQLKEWNITNVYFLVLKERMEENQKGKDVRKCEKKKNLRRSKARLYSSYLSWKPRLHENKGPVRP